MPKRTATEEDITPPIAPKVPWRVSSVSALPGFRLAVRFMDGSEGEVDLSRLVASERAGVFSKLRDPEVFAKVYLEYGAVSWPGEIDLAPDAMYDEIRANGRWVLE